MPKIQTCLVTILIGIIFLLFLKLKIIGALGFGQTPMLDFDTYYQIACDVLEGKHPYELPYMQTAGPPLVISPFIPLAFLPLQLGRVMMVWGSLIASIISCFLLAKKISSKLIWPAALTLFIFLLTAFPARFSIELGQPNLFCLLFITLLLTQKNDKRSGLWLALLTILKTFFLISSLALIRTKLQMVGFAFIIGAIIALSSFSDLKPQNYF